MKELLAHSAFAKVLLLGLLTLLAGLPLARIHGLVEERGALRNQAAAELAARHAGPQMVAGPMLVVPYVERWSEDERDDGKLTGRRIARSKTLTHLVFPEKADLNGRIAAQERYRGIFTVMFYDLKGTFSGRFPAIDGESLPRTEKGSSVEMLPPVLAFAVSDVRGLQGAPRLVLAGEAAHWSPRVPGVPEGAWLNRGIHAPLPPVALKAWQDKQPLDYRLDLTLVGQEKLAVVPLADDNTAHLASDWKHPSFGGKFLAARRTVGQSGFEADWAISSLVTSARAQMRVAAFQPVGPEGVDSFDVSLLEPLNVYALSSRAIKYGLLFVGLTLLATYMFELFRDLRLHPVQYGLVGLAITVFFLLLLALSEKVDFAIAYAIAAGASTLLLTVYFSAVLRGWGRGLGLGAYVAVLYGALYGLLSSEDNALLLGALLLFGLLGMLMIFTRRVDWYALSAPRTPQAKGTAASA